MLGCPRTTRLAVALALTAIALVAAAPIASVPGLALQLDRTGQAWALQQQSTPVELPGHQLGVLAQATPLAMSPRVASDPITLTLVLRRFDQAGMDAFLRDVQDPQSPRFRQFLSQDELAQRFGPSQQAYDAVLAYLQQSGFTLVDGSSNRLTLTVRGTREQAERAFYTTIQDFQLNSRVFYANTSNPAVPSSIASYILTVGGLNNLAQPQPRVIYVPQAMPSARVAPSPATPMSIAAAYNFAGVRLASGAPATGAGQTVGLVEYDAYSLADVQSWLVVAGLCASTDSACINGYLSRITTIQLTGPLNPSGGAGETEVLLDIDTIIGMAPGANIRVYESCNACTAVVSFQNMFNRMLQDGVSVISNSWGYCENQTNRADVQSIDAVLQSASAAGVAVFSAAGDFGATCDGFPNTADVPADAPNGTGVGGTNLQVAAGNAYQAETYWNGSCSGVPCAGGFGTSVFFAAPAYQAGLAGNNRSIPDVSANGDPSTGIFIYQADRGGVLCCVAGTSMSAPEWAAGFALLNQALGHRLGNPNTSLYSKRTTSGFHAPSTMNSDFAHVGIGSFNLGLLVAQFASACTLPRPNMLVTTAPSNGGRLLVTIATQTNQTNPSNSLQTVQFTAAPNAVLTDANGASIAVPSSVTFTSSPTAYSFFVRQAVTTAAATAFFTATDVCGDWPTFAGGGPSAFPTGDAGVPTGSASVSTPTAVPSPTIVPSRVPTVAPAATAAPAATPTPAAICAPRPQLTVATVPSGAGRLQVTITAPAATNDVLQALRFGSATNAVVEAGGQSGSGGFTVTLPPGTQQATFTLARLAADRASTVPLTVLDSCGEWPTFVGAGPAAP